MVATHGLGVCVGGRGGIENHSLGIETKKQYQRLKESASVSVPGLAPPRVRRVLECPALPFPIL